MILPFCKTSGYFYLVCVRPVNDKPVRRLGGNLGRRRKQQGLEGKGSMKWNGKNDSGHDLNAGTYIIAININGKERDAVKVVKQ